MVITWSIVIADLSGGTPLNLDDDHGASETGVGLLLHVSVERLSQLSAYDGGCLCGVRRRQCHERSESSHSSPKLPARYHGRGAVRGSRSSRMAA